MKFVHSSDSKKFVRGQGSPGVIAWEYETGNPRLNVAMVKILGRYPEERRRKNTECDMAVLVIEGMGRITVGNKSLPITKGDLVEIEKGESYFWEACPYLLVVPASHPAWRPEQNVDCD